jgi:hypothetical protein
MTDTNADEVRTPVEVIRAFTKGWLDMAAGTAQQLTELTNRAFAEADQRTEDLCRWGDDGGFCP